MSYFSNLRNDLIPNKYWILHRGMTPHLNFNLFLFVAGKSPVGILPVLEPTSEKTKPGTKTKVCLAYEHPAPSLLHDSPLLYLTFVKIHFTQADTSGVFKGGRDVLDKPKQQRFCELSSDRLSELTLLLPCALLKLNKSKCLHCLACFWSDNCWMTFSCWPAADASYTTGWHCFPAHVNAFVLVVLEFFFAQKLLHRIFKKCLKIYILSINWFHLLQPHTPDERLLSKISCFSRNFVYYG